ncbi:hypothetical protein [Streptomyces sp. NPDC002602]|uniref:hypothetical protein n=1 Tax=Streptomyces sp. NPDC002602 TaxID=3364654 RepID=UPI003673668B
MPAGRLRATRPPGITPAAVSALLLPATIGAGLPTARAGADERPVVRTDAGPVRGRSHGAFDTFEGVPGWPRFGSSGSVLSLAPGPAGVRPLDAAGEHHRALWDATGARDPDRPTGAAVAAGSADPTGAAGAAANPMVSDR